MERGYLDEKIFSIAENLNLEKIRVREVIKEYISYLKESLLTGHTIYVYDMIYIVPNIDNSKYRPTLAYDCKVIAKKLGMTTTTVYSIIKEYILSLRKNVLDGKVSEIRGLVTIHPVFNNGNLSGTHSAISLTVTDATYYVVCKVDKVRVHTFKGFKTEVKNA